MYKIIISVFLIQSFLYAKTRDKKVLKGVLYLFGLLVASFAMYLFPLFLEIDFEAAFTHSLLSVIFMAVYIPLILGLILAAYFSVMEGIVADFKKRKKGESLLFSPSVANIVFWTVLIGLFIFAPSPPPFSKL